MDYKMLCYGLYNVNIFVHDMTLYIGRDYLLLVLSNTDHPQHVVD